MIAIIDYGMGNVGSIVNMLKKIGAKAQLTADHKAIGMADKLILPGVGSFDNGMRNLHERNLIPLLNARVLVHSIPILGLCLGMQLFTNSSEEGRLPGLGWIDARTVRFQAHADTRLKIPHMGWNTIHISQSHPLFTDLDAETRFYFVHAYHVECADTRTVLAQTHYGYDFTSVISRGNILGAQFHPEKSHRFGMKLLKNFVELI